MTSFTSDTGLKGGPLEFRQAKSAEMPPRRNGRFHRIAR
jgi:hypothetical protein